MFAQYFSKTAILYLALGAAYALTAWFVHRWKGARGLLLLWLASLTTYGYVRFRLYCAQPLTCDVSGPGWALTWFLRHFPPYAAMGAVIFGSVSVIVSRLRAHGREDQLRTLDVAAGALVALGAWVLSAIVIGALRLPAE